MRTILLFTLVLQQGFGEPSSSPALSEPRMYAFPSPMEGSLKPQEAELDNPEMLSTSTEYPVVLHPRQKTQLSAEVAAPVEKIFFRMGDSFRRGELLIQLKEEVFLAKYEKALASLKKAEAELEAAQELYNDYLASNFELKEAEAALSSAQAEVISAENDLRASKIIAPYNGLVVANFAEQYELPPSDKKLIEIIDDEVLTAKLLIKAEHLKELHVGQLIDIEIASTGEKIPARLTRIGAMIDPASSTIKVEAEVDNDQRKLKAGMIGKAKLVNSRQDGR